MRRRSVVIFLVVLLLGIGFALWKMRRGEESDIREVTLDRIEQAAFLYFWENADPRTGLILDNQNNFLASDLSYSPSSVAAVGFGLSAIVVGVERGWVSRADAKDRVLTTLKTFRDKCENVHGFYYHFLDPKTAKRTWHSELSSVDSVLFLAGALTAGSYFGGEVESLAKELYERVEWPWMLNGGKTFAMGWKPEGGFLSTRWEHYDESSLLYILAIGSPTHPIPAESWKAVRREIGEYKGHVCLVSGPLFTHQYSHLWIDFRGITDGFADYWKSSIEATKANRQFCLDNASSYKTYAAGLWGLTACDAPSGYRAYGAPPGRAVHDGTVAPTGPIGSYQFTPDLSWEAIQAFLRVDGLWGRYGFADAVNLDVVNVQGKPWISTNAIGIDKGAEILSIENGRTELIWKLFSSRAEVKRGLERAGFRQGTMAMKPTVSEAPTVFRTKADRPTTTIPRAEKSPSIDGNPADQAWAKVSPLFLDEVTRERGAVSGPKDLSSSFRFLWDEKALYVLAEITDNEIVTEHAGKDIYQDDLIEIYIDPQNNLLDWGNSRDFQIGFAPIGERGEAWAWFQNRSGREAEIEYVVLKKQGGYTVEAAIPWTFLETVPERGKRIGFSFAVHDKDTDETPDAKFNWFFLDPGIYLGIGLLGG